MPEMKPMLDKQHYTSPRNHEARPSNPQPSAVKSRILAVALSSHHCASGGEEYVPNGWAKNSAGMSTLNLWQTCQDFLGE
mmetsp:Transcript_15649/g.30555  ORF Transcript_15649/g.30555 Transcript_15649/m.30555 type:complete len:80 (-) Transcript_15649:818-1057(-)|eukprot:6209012-Pleurochrysis_carterae.AAC.2